eukprot:1039843-Amphidinium_carterae.1
MGGAQLNEMTCALAGETIEKVAPYGKASTTEAGKEVDLLKRALHLVGARKGISQMSVMSLASLCHAPHVFALCPQDT